MEGEGGGGDNVQCGGYREGGGEIDGGGEKRKTKRKRERTVPNWKRGSENETAPLSEGGREWTEQGCQIGLMVRARKRGVVIQNKTAKKGFKLSLWIKRLKGKVVKKATLSPRGY